MDPPAPLEICLLGEFRVTVHGRVVPAAAWRQKRAAAIVKLLALAPSHRLHRELVIESLWPELDAEAATNNLRVALARARRSLEATGSDPGRFLFRDGEHLVLANPDQLRVDVDAFAAAVTRAWSMEDRAAARTAIDLYSGDLLPDDLYDDWAANPRTELRASYVTLLARLAQLHEQRHELGQAITTLQRLLHAEPLDESAHAALIRLFARVGEPRQALLQYERLVALLADELGAVPEPATRDLVTAIREGRFPAADETSLPGSRDSNGAAVVDSQTDGRAAGLPAQLGDLIGREREIAELQRLLASSRLLTLTGPAGVGKTRLGLAVAGAVAETDVDVAFVDLASLRDAALVLPAVARALGINETAASSLVDVMATHLAGKRSLLVLDNFEQVASAAADVARLLASCSEIRLLVTSRSRLRLRGEQEYPVQPLAVPNRSDRPGTLDAIADWERSPAVALFVQRAREAQPGYALTVTDAPVVAEICRRLDGLPLAIELAAARIRVLPLPALLARLERPLALLADGPRDAPARQQTLRAAIGWSHDLLTAEEQDLFARLAVFAGGFTLQAAEYVGGRSDPPSSPLPVLDLIASLVEQSLLRRTGAVDATPRFTMLETIREYAAEQLARSDEAAAVQSRHAAYFLAVAEEAEPELTGPYASLWLCRLEDEHANLRATLAHLSQRGDPAIALRLAGTLWRFWWLHGHLGEGRAWLERALAAGADAPAATRARALDGAGALTAAQGDLDLAAAQHAEALRLWREIGDQRGMISSLTNLGLIADEQGDARRATGFLEHALRLARTNEDRRGEAVALANLGQVALTLLDYERAASYLSQSAMLFSGLGDQRSQAAVLANLGVLEFLIGDYARATRCHEEALTLLRDLGDLQGEADEILNLGHAVQQAGDLERAATLYREALDRYEQLGDRSGKAFALIHLGRLAQLGGDAGAESLLLQGFALGQEIGNQVATVEAVEGLATVARARGAALSCARLIGFVDALRDSNGVLRPAVHQIEYDRCLTEVRLALGEEAFTAAHERGRALALEHIDAAPLALFAGEPATPES